MVSKRKPAPNQITATDKPDDDHALAVAQMVTRPTVQAAATLMEFGKSYRDLKLPSLIDSLMEQTQASSEGDLKRAESMLTAQAHTLDAIFNNLARRAINSENMNNLDRYLKLGLRAQSQCRATWDSLSTIQHPPMVGYVRQANIAHGPQQVNNASSPANEVSRAWGKSDLQNKLLEEKDGERLDPGATDTTGRVDPEMATLGEIDGTENPGR